MKIKAIHHAALKCCTQEQFARTKEFYGEILSLPIIREWDSGVMFDTGSGIVEIFNNGECNLPQGAVRHFAFLVDSADDFTEAVRKAGYEVIIEPHDVTIQSEPPYPIRVAFCIGPAGEEIEFFEER